MAKQAISTAKAPRPVASYSQAVRKGNLLALAGQGGIDAGTGELVGPGVEEQTRQALRNLQYVLEEAGASWDDVISVRVFVTDQSEFAAMNAVYADFFSAPHPARTTVFCGLGTGMKVEIDALAIVDGS